MRFIVGISSCLLSLTLTVRAASAATCVPQAEMQVIAQHFNQFSALASSDYCYDGTPTSGLIQAIEFMRKTPFAKSEAKSTDELFSGSFASDWYSYFTGRITDFQVQSDCPKGVGAFVYSFGTSMYVCPMLLTDNFTALDRTSVMMHEARHIDGYPHIMCSRGPRAGLQGACDQRMSDLGSYTVTVETYAQLGAYATDLHPALKAYARASAVIYADEAFETPANIGRTAQFLLMTTAKEFYKLPADGSSQLTRLGDSPSLGHVVMRARHMILYPEDKNLPAKYIFSHNEGDIEQQAGDLAVEYNSQSPQQRAELVDMYVGAQWSARVYRSHVLFLCDPRSSAAQDLALNGLLPVTVIYPNGYDRAASSTFVLTDSGQVVEIGCNSNKGFVRAANLKLDQKYKRVYKVGSEVLGLSVDGRLFQINGATSTALPTRADGKIFELIPNESYQFFDSAGA